MMFSSLTRWATTATTRRQMKPRTRLRAGLEDLERRECLSTTVSLAGGTLNIVGDDAANNVAVYFRDSVNDIRVQVDGVDHHFSSLQVQNLNVDLKGGDDGLYMQLGADSDTSAAMFDPKNMNIKLGDGNDAAQIWFGGLSFPGRAIATNLNISLDAGLGDDDVTANFPEVQSGTLNYAATLGDGNDRGFAGLWGNVGTGATARLALSGDAGDDILNTYETYNGGYDNVNISEGALLDVNVQGGPGNDQLNMTYGGNVRGKLQIRQDGGDGNDSIKGDIHLQGLNTGAVDAVFLGGNGRDGLRMEMYGSSRLFRGLIDGGGGFDRATGVGNVTIINANELIVTDPNGDVLSAIKKLA